MHVRTLTPVSPGPRRPSAPQGHEPSDPDTSLWTGRSEHLAARLRASLQAVERELEGAPALADAFASCGAQADARTAACASTQGWQEDGQALARVAARLGLKSFKGVSGSVQLDPRYWARIAERGILKR
ncbi:MAG: hypothetical protein HY319_15905 [Armatimonadetes bacterium]|nr:hypothetical protein [Armatimonadota bacterium]